MEEKECKGPFWFFCLTQCRRMGESFLFLVLSTNINVIYQQECRQMSLMLSTNINAIINPTPSNLLAEQMFTCCLGKERMEEIYQ
jgi:hypothetical protein